MRDSVWFGAASLLPKLVALGTIPIITRSLTPSDFGVFELISGMAAFLVVLFSMSLESYLARKWNDSATEGQKSELLSTLILLCLLVSLAGFAIVLTVSPLLSVGLFGVANYGLAFVLVGMNSVLTSVASLPIMALRMSGGVVPFPIITATQSSALLILIVASFALNNINVVTLISANFISGFVSAVVAFSFIRRYLSLSFKVSVVKPALRFSLPLMPAVGVTWATGQVDRYALLYFAGADAVGLYSILVKAAAIMVMLIAVFRQAWLPYSYKIAAQHDSRESQFKQISIVFFVVALSLSIGLVSIQDVLLEILAPETYEIDTMIFPVLLLSAVIYGSSAITGIGTMVSGKTEWNSIAAMLGLGFNVVVAIFAIPRYGMVGAAWGALGSNTLFTLILCWRSSKDIGISFPLGQITVSILAYSAICFYLLA